MPHRIETTAPDEVKGVMELLAGLLDIYADDQLASQRFSGSSRHKHECQMRSDIYRDLAKEFRETVVTHGGVDDVPSTWGEWEREQQEKDREK